MSPLSVCLSPLRSYRALVVDGSPPKRLLCVGNRKGQKGVLFKTRVGRKNGTGDR